MTKTIRLTGMVVLMLGMVTWLSHAQPGQNVPQAPMPGMVNGLPGTPGDMPADPNMPGMGMSGCQKCQEKKSRGDEGHGRGAGGKGSDLREMFFKKSQMLWKHQAELGISEDQLAAISSLKAAVEKDLIQKDADSEVIGIDIQQRMMEDPIDVKAVNVLLDKKYEAKKAAARSLVSACAELRKILTEEQKQKMKQLMMGQEKRHDHR